MGRFESPTPSKQLSPKRAHCERGAPLSALPMPTRNVPLLGHHHCAVRRTRVSGDLALRNNAVSAAEVISNRRCSR